MAVGKCEYYITPMLSYKQNRGQRIVFKMWWYISCWRRRTTPRPCCVWSAARLCPRARACRRVADARTCRYVQLRSARRTCWTPRRFGGPFINTDGGADKETKYWMRLMLVHNPELICKILFNLVLRIFQKHGDLLLWMWEALFSL